MNGPLVNRMGREGQLEEACDEGRACPREIAHVHVGAMRGQEVHAVRMHRGFASDAGTDSSVPLVMSDVDGTTWSAVRSLSMIWADSVAERDVG